MKEQELKPCQICGATDEVELVKIGEWVLCRCNMCDTKSGFYETEEDAINAWNRRADDEQ